MVRPTSYLDPSSQRTFVPLLEPLNIYHTENCGMVDAYDRLREGISKKLPNEADKKLLKELVEIIRNGGQEKLQDKVKEIIDKVGGES